MQRLFIELYLDEDVGVLIAQLIRARGFAAVTARDAGNRGVSDDQQLVYAVRQQWTLLTHNRLDFEALHQSFINTGREHSGIIIAVRRPPYEIARRLLLILNHVTADEMQNQLRYI